MAIIPGLAEKTKKAEEKRESALRSLSMGRQERKSQIEEQRTTIEGESAKLKSDLKNYFPGVRKDIAKHRNAGMDAQVALRRTGDTGKQAERQLERVNQLDARLASERLTPEQKREVQHTERARDRKIQGSGSELPKRRGLEAF